MIALVPRILQAKASGGRVLRTVITARSLYILIVVVHTQLLMLLTLPVLVVVLVAQCAVLLGLLIMIPHQNDIPKFSHKL